ncbi:hypothetical protein BUALT_Bualt09G0035600 [Buddleja alternifolia]|uniref:J domain-containing protein n=1 Tax=Buddleja alternifolia TaxID=168488 RepID=A0AAV6X8A8_9LAMI|nr:hypothetical protein BUALT_Bualt09G0035600 [Buddleja alternifolia]
MECNKDEAIRAKEIAVKKMENNDFEGARKIALKAKNLYPELDNIAQMLSICDVHCSAQKRLSGSEKDWYGILQVENSADESTVKKQYRKLALILHPDKNRFSGAEGAFKLICEANAVLSDPTKKTLYDSKIRVSLLNKQNGAQKNVSNGFSSTSQNQSTRSNPSVRQDVFWTCCPYCNIRYMYHRECLNKHLRCQTCAKLFTGYEIGAQNVPSKPDSSRPNTFQEKVGPKQGKSKLGVQIDKGHSSTQVGTGYGGIGVGSASKNSGDLKAKETDTRNVNSSHGGKEAVKVNGDAESRENNKSRKRGRKLVADSGESCDISSNSDLEDVTVKGPANDLDSESSRAHFVRRSSRKRQDVSYNEIGENDLANTLKRSQASKLSDGNEQKGDLDSEDLEHGNQNSYPTDADYSNSDQDKEAKARGDNGGVSDNTAADTVEMESDMDPDCENSENDVLHCPDPEFSDFDMERDESRFDVNQFWACYDTLDGMPRFYAKVRKVCASPFELSFTWLEADPINEAFEEWVDEELPVGCGSFKLGKTEKTSAKLTFSHQVHCEKGNKRGSLVIYPRVGEVWALFKDWDVSWSTNPDIHKENFKYEIVEILSDFVAGEGVKVCYLDKVRGFLSLFQRSSKNKTNSFLIGPNELYKFSHCVPCFKMSGLEKEGVPLGSFELDPASLPMNPDDLYYPSKIKMESVDMDHGVDSLQRRCAEKKSKSVISDGMSTPEKFVDYDGINRDMSKLRRSPRVSNVIKQNAN